ncbi:MAG: Cohesin domain protein [Oscillospiraceae bacterium]|nr:Cohesin domain protein [Oscillospiraceae bacterium]
MKTTKIVSGLMAMAMAVAAMGVTASAAENVDVKIGKASAEAGKSFSVDVELGSVPSSGISSVDFAISYDSSALKIENVKLGKVGDTGAKAQEGDLGDTLFNWYDNGKQIVVVWATGLTDSQYWIKSSGVFLTIEGSVKDGTAKGEYKLTGGGADRAAYPGSSDKAGAYLSAVGATATTDYTAAFTNGSVTVGGGGGQQTDADWGNADEKDEVDVSDAVLVARFAVGDSVNISDQGQINADVTHDGQVNGDDVLKIVKYVAGFITEDDLAKA